MKKNGPVAIIGAGLSGLSCAKELNALGVEIQIFEKSGRPGGRCATLLWQGHLVDTGVQYFTTSMPEFKKELLSQLFHFRPIVAPIVDRNGNPIPNNGSPRYYTLQGNNFLGHVLATSLPMESNVTVESVEPTYDGEYMVQGKKFAAVVSCAPFPQTAKIFGLNDAATTAGSRYLPCLTALIEYSGLRIGNSLKYYASMDILGKSIVRWTACENHKAGRIVGEKTVMVVHASPEFSQEHIDSPPEVYLPLLFQENEAIWALQGCRKTALTGHLWRYARSIDPTNRQFNLPNGLFICGDSRCPSDVEKVWADGRRAAADVMSYLCAA